MKARARFVVSGSGFTGICKDVSMNQKSILKIKIQRYLDDIKNEFPLLIRDYRMASLSRAVEMLWNERRFIGCTNVDEATWKEIATLSFSKWKKENRK